MRIVVLINLPQGRRGFHTSERTRKFEVIQNTYTYIEWVKMGDCIELIIQGHPGLSTQSHWEWRPRGDKIWATRDRFLRNRWDDVELPLEERETA